MQSIQNQFNQLMLSSNRQLIPQNTYPIKLSESINFNSDSPTLQLNPFKTTYRPTKQYDYQIIDLNNRSTEARPSSLVRFSQSTPLEKQPKGKVRFGNDIEHDLHGEFKYKCFKCYGNKNNSYAICHQCKGIGYINENHPLARLFKKILSKKMPKNPAPLSQLKPKQELILQQEEARKSNMQYYACKEAIKQQDFSYVEDMIPFCKICHIDCDINNYKYCDQCSDYFMCLSCYSLNQNTHQHFLGTKCLSRANSQASYQSQKKSSNHQISSNYHQNLIENDDKQSSTEPFLNKNQRNSDNSNRNMEELSNKEPSDYEVLSKTKRHLASQLKSYQQVSYNPSNLDFEIQKQATSVYLGLFQEEQELVDEQMCFCDNCGEVLQECYLQCLTCTGNNNIYRICPACQQHHTYQHASDHMLQITTANHYNIGNGLLNRINSEKIEDSHHLNKMPKHRSGVINQQQITYTPKEQGRKFAVLSKASSISIKISSEEDNIDTFLFPTYNKESLQDLNDIELDKKQSKSSQSLQDAIDNLYGEREDLIHTHKSAYDKKSQFIQQSINLNPTNKSIVKIQFDSLSSSLDYQQLAGIDQNSTNNQNNATNKESFLLKIGELDRHVEEVSIPSIPSFSSMGNFIEQEDSFSNSRLKKQNKDQHKSTKQNKDQHNATETNHNDFLFSTIKQSGKGVFKGVNSDDLSHNKDSIKDYANIFTSTLTSSITTPTFQLEEPQKQLSNNPEQYLFIDYQCDICHACPIRNVRYHCLKCQDFDLCQHCFTHQRKLHQHLNNFQKIDGIEILKKKKDAVQQLKNDLVNQILFKELVKNIATTTIRNKSQIMTNKGQIMTNKSQIMANRSQIRVKQSKKSVIASNRSCVYSERAN